MQLQQVILNLLINATEAMSGMSEGPRELLISTTKTDSEGVLVAVRDWGPGLAPERVDRLFRPSTRPNLAAWEWGCRSAARSLKLITDDCGRPRTPRAVPFFNSHCRDTHMVRKKIVEDLCSIHMAANVSRRVCAQRRIWRGVERALLYHPAPRPCFSRHFGPGPRM